MSKVDYCLTGIDEEGNIALEMSLTQERAMEIVLEEIRAGRAKIEVVADGSNTGHAGKILDKDTLGPVLKDVKSKKDKKPKEEKGEKKGGKTRQRVMDLYNEGMRDADAMADKLGMTGPAVRYHLNAEGVTYDSQRGVKKAPKAEAKKETEEETPARPDYKTVRTKELLKDGKTPLEVSTELGIGIQAVNFIRTGMIKRGELNGS